MFRVRQAAPFSQVGIDFAGPLFVRQDRGGNCSSKVYMALFSCCVTRTIHLELVCNLSAETFLRCLRRFAARRGFLISQYQIMLKLSRQQRKL